jgi:uncharacterized membrane protein
MTGLVSSSEEEPMSKIKQTIEVNVPVHAAYEQLTHFEDYPRFMTGVTQVTQVSDTNTHWVMNLDGSQREFDAQITERKADHKVAWRTTGEPKLLSESITLKSVSPACTQIIAELDADVAALMPGERHAQDALSRQLKTDLGRFKEYVEMQNGSEAPALR